MAEGQIKVCEDNKEHEEKEGMKEHKRGRKKCKINCAKAKWKNGKQKQEKAALQRRGERISWNTTTYNRQTGEEEKSGGRMDEQSAPYSV